MRLLLLYLFSFLTAFNCLAQIRVYTENFTAKNGLAQNEVNDFAKDSCGFIWLATENGLSRFDGYSFTNHSISTSQFHCSLNNQYKQILIDASNNIYARNSMGQVLVYNQKKQTYTLFPNPSENRGDNYMFISKMLKKNGIWFLGADRGAIYITTNNKSNGFETFSYCFNDSLTGSVVNNIFIDNEQNTWILTNKGLAFIPAKSTKITNTFYVKENYAFTDAVDLGNDLVFVGENGLVIRYDKLKKRYSEKKICQSNLDKVFKLSDGNTLLSSYYNGVYSYNILSNELQTICSLPGLNKSWIDDKSNIWFSDNGLLYRFLTTNSKLEKTNLKLQKNTTAQNDIFSYGYLDNSGDWLWLLSEKADLSQASSKVNKVLKDKSGVFWSNYNSEGIQKLSTVNSTVQFVKCANSEGKKSIVNAVLEDNLGNLWIATSDQRLRLFTKNMNLIGYANKNGVVTSTDCTFGNISTLYQDREGNLWIGCDKLLYQYSAVSQGKQYKIRAFALDKGTPEGTIITDILEDKNGKLWLATDGDGLQLLQYDANSYHFINRRNDLRNSYPPTLLKTNCLYEDRNGNIWLGASEGLTIFSPDFPQLRFLKFFYYNPENSNMATSMVSGLYQDKDGKMWIASYGGGLLRSASAFELGEAPEFIAYNRENNKLNSNLVLSIEEDAKGLLWIATEKSLVKFDKATGKSESYGFVNELGNSGFGRQIFIRTRTDAFVLGSNSGFYYIDPNNIHNDDFIPPMVLTKFQLFNKDVDLSLEDAPLSCDINFTDEITLQPNQNVFSIEYAALDYRNSLGIEYAYKLDNFEEEWNYVGSQRIATYTNLPPGDYTFRVKSTNVEGNWCNNDKTITIHVLPTFWQTGWAWLLYILIFAGIIGGLIYAYLAFYKMQSKMKFEQEISTMKMQFFTDISHELRTPLTLINAPLENVLDNGTISAEDRKQLEIVHSNTTRMLRMLTQILDFRKLQSNKMRLRVEKTNIYQLVAKCCGNFNKMAESRHITFEVNDKTNGDLYWVDRDKIDTVMFNLLSNAFKFTPEGKRVSVNIESIDNQCVIKVEDEGCGMPKDKLNLIFDRYSTLRPKSLTNQSGTGIGLALVKEILDLHKAAIEVESQEGEGSVFTVKLNGGTEHYDEISADIIINDEETPNNNAEVEVPIETEDKEKLKLLVIEDNDDLRQFIVSILSKSFNTIEAPNGRIGKEKTIAEMPDFVLTDIMMPEMDGVEYVRQIRENEQTSHIPVVLLTAKTDMQSKIECLKIGANDYITKPFSMVYLQARIENILAERKSWQEKYRNQLQHTGYVATPQTTAGAEVAQNEKEVDKRDDEFMKKMVDYINANLDNTDLSPEELANGLKVSRWNLTCKVKSLVGQPPIEFIKDIRLNKAAQLIREGELSMTQITYMIGMTDSRYFSRCFKQKFGMTPTEYKNKKD